MRQTNVIAQAARTGLGVIDPQATTGLSEDLTWRRPTGSAATTGNGGGGIEVAATSQYRLIRVGGTDSPVLVFETGYWDQFISGAKRGEFDNLPVTVT